MSSVVSRLHAVFVMMLVPALIAISALASSRAHAEPSTANGVVNINTATIEQLMLLPRVGESKAQRILDFRQKTPFKTVNELGRVKGFGLKTLRLLKPLLRVDGPTTLTTEVTPEEAQQLAAAPESPKSSVPPKPAVSAPKAR
jgi:competence protein ComEA